MKWFSVLLLAVLTTGCSTNTPSTPTISPDEQKRIDEVQKQMNNTNSKQDFQDMKARIENYDMQTQRLRKTLSDYEAHLNSPNGTLEWEQKLRDYHSQFNGFESSLGSRLASNGDLKDVQKNYQKFFDELRPVINSFKDGVTAQKIVQAKDKLLYIWHSFADAKDSLQHLKNYYNMQYK